MSVRMAYGGMLLLLTIIVLLFLIMDHLTISRFVENHPKSIESKEKDIYNDPEMKSKRRMALEKSRSIQQKLYNVSRQADNNLFYAALVNEAYCPVIKRIGESGDGGKFVCDPSKVKKECVMMSLGLNNQIGYEKMIQNVTDMKCSLIGADIGEQSEKTKTEYKGLNGRIFKGKIPNDITISKMMKDAGAKEVEMLKIDIEGGEFEAIEPFVNEYFVCQIFIEIHGSPTQHLQMMQTIAQYGFRMFSNEPNIYCKSCCEYSYINELCMSQYDVIPLAITVPQPSIL